jgi:hypothetical protein
MNVLDSHKNMPLKPYWYNTSNDIFLRRQFAKKTGGCKRSSAEVGIGGEHFKKNKG